MLKFQNSRPERTNNSYFWSKMGFWEGPCIFILDRPILILVVWTFQFKMIVNFRMRHQIKTMTLYLSKELWFSKKWDFEKKIWEDDLAFWSFIPQKILDNNSNIKSQTKSRFICYTNENHLHFDLTKKLTFYTQRKL